MEKVLIRLILVALLMVFIAPLAHSELLVYEPFDYEVGDLEGNICPLGLYWGGWQEWGSTIPAQVVEGNLIHPLYEIEGLGNHVELMNGGSGEGFSTILYDDGEDIWMSFLYQDNLDHESWNQCTMLFYNEDVDGTAVDILLNDGTPGLYSLHTDTEQTAIVADPSAVMWVVIKAETSGSSSTTEMVYMWVNPTPEAVPDPAAADVALEYDIHNGAEANHIHVMAWADEPGPWAYRLDELRIGREFDDVTVELPCENASSPQPVNGATLVEVELQALVWDAPTCVDDPAYNLYFSSDPNLPSQAQVVDHGTKSRWNVDRTLEYDTTYYWRVDVIEFDGVEEIVHEGRVWRFTTLSLKPVFLIQPESTTVPVGADVEFSVELFNSNDQEWYYSETPDGPGTLISDSNSLTLNVTDVQLANEGYYYCKAWNFDLGMTNIAYSNRARLLTERLMAHWKFEDNLNNEVDSLNNGVPVGSISYTGGIDGQAVVIDEPAYIQTTNDLGELTEITVSMWIKPDALSGKQTFLTAAGSADRGNIRLRLSEDEFLAEVLGGVSLGGALVTPSEWNHCVFVYDTSGKWSGIYLNGESVNTANTSAAPLLSPLSIGSDNGVDSYNGLIDDLRIYDYRLSNLEVASLYTALVPEADICLGNPAYDLSGNCQVDLEDLALVLSEWLKCHIVPTCLP